MHNSIRYDYCNEGRLQAFNPRSQQAPPWTQTVTKVCCKCPFQSGSTLIGQMLPKPSPAAGVSATSAATTGARRQRGACCQQPRRCWHSRCRRCSAAGRQQHHCRRRCHTAGGQQRRCRRRRRAARRRPQACCRAAARPCARLRSRRRIGSRRRRCRHGLRRDSHGSSVPAAHTWVMETVVGFLCGALLLSLDS